MFSRAQIGAHQRQLCSIATEQAELVEELRAREPGPSAILGRQDRGRGARPLYAYFRIVPAQRSLVARSIVLGALVNTVRELADDVEAVREAGRDPHPPRVLGRESFSNAMQERRRAPPKLNRDVEDLSRRHGHGRALRAAELIVQAAQRTAHGSTVVVLHELP